MDIKVINSFIKKILKYTKPEGVIDIEFEVNHLMGNEYYINLTYIVPEDSDYLKVKNMDDLDITRIGWNRSIKKTIESHLGIKMYISSTGIRSESYNRHLKSE
jgi:hypothetical protein